MSQQEFVGVISKIGEKSWSGKTLWSIFLKPDGESQDIMIGLGMDKPSVSALSRVKVTASKNAKGYWTCKNRDIELLKDEPAPAPSGGGGKASGGFQDRQASIVLQSSYKTATDQVNALLAAGLFKPASNTKSRKESAMDAYFSFIDKVAVEIYNKAMEPDKFLDEYISNMSFEESNSNPGPNEDEGRPIEDDLPDF